MTSLGAIDSRNILRDINSCSDIACCFYCGNYSTGLKINRRDQVVCISFEDCVYNRLEDGSIAEARAAQLLGHPLTQDDARV